jgi:hypothetical protein
MNTLLVLIAVVIVSAPIIAAVVVSIAVFREESMHSLIGRAPGPIERRARTVLAFHSEASCEPLSQADAWRALVPVDYAPFADQPLAGQPAAGAAAAPWRTGR